MARRRGETEFGNIYSSWIKTYWKHSAFTFLQEAFDLYVFEKYSSSQWLLESHRYREHPQFAKDLKLIGVDEAAKILGVAFKTVKFFLRTKQLTNYKEHNERYYVRDELVSRTEVLALRDKLKDRISKAEVSSWLGTNYHIINDLIEVGLLVPEPRMKSEKCASQGVLTKSTVIAGVERIVKHVKTWTGTELQQNDFLDLALAAQIAAATLGLNTAKLLLSVSEGKLRAYCRVNSSLELNNLIFSRTDIQSWIDSIRAEKNWMIQEAAVDFLGVKHETFINWIELGFISPVAVIGTKKYFDRLSIEQFRHDYVPSEEAAHILGIRLSCLYQWMKRGWLDGIFIGEKFTKEHHSYYLFNREHLVKWRNERVNADEAARLLGINREALRYLVRKGKLNPLPKMGTHPYWFSRKDVLQRNNRKD